MNSESSYAGVHQGILEAVMPLMALHYRRVRATHPCGMLVGVVSDPSDRALLQGVVDGGKKVFDLGDIAVGDGVRKFYGAIGPDLRRRFRERRNCDMVVLVVYQKLDVCFDVVLREMGG